MNENIRKLREAVDNNKLVIFVGAGVSASSELPDWKQLIEEFRDALEMDKSKPISSDEYLKIPQYYYNMRGFKDYFDIINNVFNKHYEPNKIHELIFRLSPQHIITTNYDNLIEQEMDKQGLLYDVVSEDKDLPYTPNGKLLIKMHGDLQKKNIVLKEEDYLSYEENFRLIETFVKALFVNHTVAFVGYSLGDYNLKLILNSVKSILGKHFQKGYIINSNDKPKSSYENNYFYNMGFNVVDVNSIPPNYNCNNYGFIKNKYGKAIVNILSYIENYKDEPDNILELYYKKLQIFTHLNFIHINDLFSILEFKYINNYDGNIEIYGDKCKDFLQKLIEIDTLLDGVNKDDVLLDKEMKMFKYISETFLKSNIKKVSLSKTLRRAEENNVLSYTFNSLYDGNSEILKRLLLMDYKDIDLIAQKNFKSSNIHNSKYFNGLFKAYCNYLTERYVSAFKILKEVSQDSYKDKDYLACYISEFNKSNIIKILKTSVAYNSNPFNCSIIREKVFIEEIYILIKEYESSTINMDIVYAALSKKEKKSIGNMQLLRFDNNFIHERLNHIRQLKKQVLKDTKYLFSGYSTHSSINKIREEVKDFWYSSNENYLTITHYKEINEYYNIYIYSLLSTYSKDKPDPQNNSILPGLPSYNLKKHHFDLMDINIIITFITAEEFIEFINEFKIKSINIDKEIDIIKILKNIVDSYKNIEFNNNLRTFLNSFLILISHLNLENIQTKNILPILSEILNTSAINNKTYTYINYFIYHQSKLAGSRYKYILDVGIRHLIDMFINKLLNDKFNNTSGGFELEALAQDNFIEILLQNLKIKNNIIKNNNLYNKLIHSINYGTLSNHKITLITKLLIPIYKSITKEQKTIISNLLHEELNENFDISLYIKSCINHIILPDTNLENKLWNEVDKELKNRNNLSMSFPDPLETKLSDISSLLFNEQVLDIDKARLFIGYNNIYDLLIDINNFDYKNKFELEWLTTLNPKILEDIAHIPKAKAQIKNKAIPTLIKKLLNENQLRMFFKYFN